MASPHDKALLQELSIAWSDLRELVDWWHLRKAFFERVQDPGSETEFALKTYHVDRRFVTLIKQLADCECTTQKEIINRALQQFFAARETAPDHHD